MALVRVFLLTCRRPTLLPRALDSLLKQTFTDWVCELHNDAPEDDGPRRLLEEIGDPRIILHQHPSNWGAVKTFQHAFAGGPEPFSSLLEDDNWWEPEFLATALSAIQSHPKVNLVWANLHMWRENHDHSWSPTGRTIWEYDAQTDTTPHLFQCPEPIQCFDALHSNGATLFRSSISRAAPIPDDTPFAVIEFVRERLLPGPLMLLPEPLGHFAVTLKTARSDKRESWLASQLLCAASYQLTIHPRNEELRNTWEVLRKQSPPGTNLLFHVALSGVRPVAILRYAHLADWFRFIRSLVRHPLSSLRALHFRSQHPKTWQALLAVQSSSRSIQNPAPFYQKTLISRPLSASTQETLP